MAIRAASIWRAVPAHERLAKSPNALRATRGNPRRRPRCCFLNLTSSRHHHDAVSLRESGIPDARIARRTRFLRDSLCVSPLRSHLDADDPYVALASAVPCRCRLQRVQRQTSVLVPLRAGDFGAVQAPANANVPLAPKRNADSMAHGPAEGDTRAPAAWRCHSELRVELRRWIDVYVHSPLTIFCSSSRSLSTRRPCADDDAGRECRC